MTKNKELAVANASHAMVSGEMEERKCGECTECCSGTLKFSVHGEDYGLGKPCRYVTSGGCSIYETRPFDPCVGFKCAWLTFPNLFADDLRPDLCNVIITIHRFGTEEDEVYIRLNPTNDELNAKVLSWVFFKYLEKRIGNILYPIEGKFHYIGNSKFCKFASEGGYHDNK